jgi:hypothetical protein
MIESATSSLADEPSGAGELFHKLRSTLAAATLSLENLRVFADLNPSVGLNARQGKMVERALLAIEEAQLLGEELRLREARNRAGDPVAGPA